MGRLCPPIPLHRTLKEGHGGGWGEVRRMKHVGIRGRGRSPIPRRSLPTVHTRTSTSDMQSDAHQWASWLKTTAAPPEKEPQQKPQSSVGVGQLMDYGLWLLPSLFPPVGGQKGSYLAKMCFSPLFKGVFDTHPRVKRVQFGYF